MKLFNSLFILKNLSVCKRNIFVANLKSVLPFRQTFYRNTTLFEPSRRGRRYPFLSKKTLWEHLRDGSKIFNRECKLFAQEVKDKFIYDAKIYRDGDTDIFYRFDSEENLKNWKLSYDKLFNEGFSECTLSLNEKHKAVFKGNVDITLPKDGIVTNAGYCIMKSMKKRLAFFRHDYHEWEVFTHLEMRVKGDGRNYAINLSIYTQYDLMWFDTFTYILFTHGGPYWQTVRIPFSKFFLTSKGRTQDKQGALPRNRINSIAITCATVPGPFHLEIDYIGCHIDRSHTEEFAYEMYRYSKQIVSE